MIVVIVKCSWLFGNEGWGLSLTPLVVVLRRLCGMWRVRLRAVTPEPRLWPGASWVPQSAATAAEARQAETSRQTLWHLAKTGQIQGIRRCGCACRVHSAQCTTFGQISMFVVLPNSGASHLAWSLLRMLPGTAWTRLEVSQSQSQSQSFSEGSHTKGWHICPHLAAPVPDCQRDESCRCTTTVPLPVITLTNNSTSWNNRDVFFYFLFLFLLFWSDMINISSDPVLKKQ